MYPKFLVVDLFCGAGGTSLGYEMTNGLAKVIACINHDRMAIESHKANHPHAVHFLEDLRRVNLLRLKKVVDSWRKKYPWAKLILWASLPCPHFSNARGAQPKDDEIRTLAYSLYMQYDFEKKMHVKGDSYMQILNPDYLKIENVTEFMSWGPLNEMGKPISRRNGQEFIKWQSGICDLGYKVDWEELNSADFGSYTKRNRLFGCFAKHDLPIVWPEPTHSKKLSGSLFAPLKPWKAVKDVLDLADTGKSIFNRKKPLSDKTLNVIAKGLAKSIAAGEPAFMFKYYGNGDNLNSINEPAGTIPTKDRFAIIFRQYRRGYTSSIDEPLGAIPTTPKANLVSFIMNKSHGGHTTPTSSPCPVIVASQHKAPLYVIQALMSENGIEDITMRMLKVSELKLIQGFPTSYMLKGNQTDQKRQIGNSVEPNVIKAWALTFGKIYENDKAA